MTTVTELTIQTRQTFSVTGMVLHCKQGGDPAIPRLWERFGPHMHTLPNVVDRQVAYGVCYNFVMDPDVQEFDYMAGVEVTAGSNAPEEMARLDIPEKTYAVFTTTLPKIGETYDRIYGGWLAQGGYKRTAGPEFEVYDEHFNPNDPASELQLFIPVEPA